MSNVLETFVGSAERRTSHPFGNAWIAIVLPIALELLQQCLNNRGALQSFAEGRRRPLQVAALTTRCRQAARTNGVPLFRSISVGNDMANAILAELDDVARSGRMGDATDPYQAALDEVAEMLG